MIKNIGSQKHRVDIQERLAALELMRQINYGYDPTTARLERVLEIVEFPSD